MQKKIQIILIILGLIIASCLFLVFNSILYPAYISVVSDCYPAGEEVTANLGYITAAVTTVDLSTGNQSIQYFVKPDRYIILHEECHVRQYEEGRLSSCLNLIGKYENEIECYFLQNF